MRRSKGVVITQSMYLRDSLEDCQFVSIDLRGERREEENVPCVENRTSVSRVTSSIELGFDGSIPEITRQDEVCDSSGDEDSSREIMESSMSATTLMSDEENDQRRGCEFTESSPEYIGSLSSHATIGVALRKGRELERVS